MEGGQLKADSGSEARDIPYKDYERLTRGKAYDPLKAYFTILQSRSVLKKTLDSFESDSKEEDSENIFEKMLESLKTYETLYCKSKLKNLENTQDPTNKKMAEIIKKIESAVHCKKEFTIKCKINLLELYPFFVADAFETYLSDVIKSAKRQEKITLFSDQEIENGIQEKCFNLGSRGYKVHQFRSKIKDRFIKFNLWLIDQIEKKQQVRQQAKALKGAKPAAKSLKRERKESASKKAALLISIDENITNHEFNLLEDSSETLIPVVEGNLTKKYIPDDPYPRNSQVIENKSKKNSTKGFFRKHKRKKKNNECPESSLQTAKNEQNFSRKARSGNFSNENRRFKLQVHQREDSAGENFKLVHPYILRVQEEKNKCKKMLEPVSDFISPCPNDLD